MTPARKLVPGQVVVYRGRPVRVTAVQVVDAVRTKVTLGRVTRTFGLRSALVVVNA